MLINSTCLDNNAFLVGVLIYPTCLLELRGVIPMDTKKYTPSPCDSIRLYAQ